MSFPTLPFLALPWLNDLALPNHRPLVLLALADFPSFALLAIFVDLALANLLVESKSTDEPFVDSDLTRGSLARSIGLDVEFLIWPV